MSNQKRWANGAADTSVATPPATSQRCARAVSLHLDGRGDEALVELERALRGGEKRAEIYSAIGYIHYERKQFDEATAAYRRLLELESNHPNGCFNLALCLQASEQWKEASHLFEKSLTSNPSRKEAYLGLGACQLHLGAARRAQEAYDSVLAKEPNLESALFGKAVALQLQKDLKGAGEIYQRILKQNPASEETLTNLAWLSGE